MAKRTTVKVVVKGDSKVTITITPRKAKPAAALNFGEGNAKLKGIHTFSLPAGHACPGALECLSRADKETGKISDGKHTAFRCFSASQEATYPSVRKARWRNMNALKGKTTAEMAALILTSLPAKVETVRVHVSGDFFSQAYFDAWMAVAAARPAVLFYGYTKSLLYWLARIDSIPANFVLTASLGGRHDALISEHGLRSALVVFTEADATARGLAIDHDDSHAMTNGPSFALLLHGVQPKGTDAARALYALRSKGDYGYGERADARRAALPVLN